MKEKLFIQSLLLFHSCTHPPLLKPTSRHQLEKICSFYIGIGMVMKHPDHIRMIWSDHMKIVHPRREVKIFFSIYVWFIFSIYEWFYGIQMTARIKLIQCKKKKFKICWLGRVINIYLVFFLRCLSLIYAVILNTVKHT